MEVESFRFRQLFKYEVNKALKLRGMHNVYYSVNRL